MCACDPTNQAAPYRKAHYSIKIEAINIRNKLKNWAITMFFVIHVWNMSLVTTSGKMSWHVKSDPACHDLHRKLSGNVSKASLMLEQLQTVTNSCWNNLKQWLWYRCQHTGIVELKEKEIIRILEDAAHIYRSFW